MHDKFTRIRGSYPDTNGIRLHVTKHGPVREANRIALGMNDEHRQESEQEKESVVHGGSLDYRCSESKSQTAKRCDLRKRWGETPSSQATDRAPSLWYRLVLG